MKAELKKEIEKMSIEMGISELKYITVMQGICVKNNDTKTLDILCELKWDYIKV
jgi:hypothetical protein